MSDNNRKWIIHCRKLPLHNWYNKDISQIWQFPKSSTKYCFYWNTPTGLSFWCNCWCSRLFNKPSNVWIVVVWGKFFYRNVYIMWAYWQFGQFRESPCSIWFQFDVGKFVSKFLRLPAWFWMGVYLHCLIYFCFCGLFEINLAPPKSS